MAHEERYSVPAHSTSVYKPTDTALTTTAFSEDLLEAYSDREVVHFIQHSPPLVNANEEPVVLLSPNLIAKRVGDNFGEDPLDEVLAMQRARACGVNVPAVRRLVRCEDEDVYYLIMERIHGTTLDHVWRRLGWCATLRAAWQLRSYLRRLRSVTSQTTGGLNSGRTYSEWLQDQMGPVRYASPAAFTGYLNWWLVQCRPEYCSPRPDLVLEPVPEHVLVHQDLAPRNMILDRRGRLWLIDWGHAGFYPPYMENFGLEVYTGSLPWSDENTWTGWWARLRWTIFCWIAAGWSSRYRHAWKAFAVISIRTQRFKSDKTPFSDTL
ncbi:kinase-like protein [Trametes sanguinea]|nr:kinase-like protein [Trametes sanguinea]